jgi:AcrR family transcriptional regulator
MREGWRQTRKTFRHGHLAEALVAAALARLEADGTEALSLRELARDAGVNHRAVYRHFPDKLALLARVAEQGWWLMDRRVRQQVRGKPKGRPALIAGGVGFYLFAREHPNLFHFMAGPRVNADAAFPDLEKQVAAAMAPFRQAFVDDGMSEGVARIRTALFLSALEGVVTQILHGRLYVPRAKAKPFIADTCKRLFDGLR